jgi:hypothetical protein
VSDYFSQLMLGNEALLYAGDSQKNGHNNMQKPNALLPTLITSVTIAQAPQDVSAVQVVSQHHVS